MSEIDVNLLKLLAVNLSHAAYTDPASQTWVLEQLSIFSRKRANLTDDQVLDVDSTIQQLQSTLPTSRL